MIKQPQSFGKPAINVLYHNSIFYFIPIFIISIISSIVKENHLIIQFSPDIPHNEIRFSNISLFQQPFYVYTFTPLKTSSLVIQKLHHHLLLLPKYGDYYHPIFKFYCIDNFFSLLLYPHNTDNEIYVSIYDKFTGKLIFGFKFAFFIFILFFAIISLFNNYPKELKIFMILVLVYGLHKIVSFFASIPIEYLFQSIFFGLFIIYPIYQLQLTDYRFNTTIIYIFYASTFVIVTFFYLSILFLILQKIMLFIWTIFNLFYIYILFVGYYSNTQSFKFLLKEIILQISLLNSIFIYSILQTHITGSSRVLFLTFLDIIAILYYITQNVIDFKNKKKINYSNDKELFLIDIAFS